VVQDNASLAALPGSGGPPGQRKRNDRSGSRELSTRIEDSVAVHFSDYAIGCGASGTCGNLRYFSNPYTPFFTNHPAAGRPQILRKKSHFFAGRALCRPIGV
jgi:hypothetical protein